MSYILRLKRHSSFHSLTALICVHVKKTPNWPQYRSLVGLTEMLHKLVRMASTAPADAVGQATQICSKRLRKKERKEGRKEGRKKERKLYVSHRIRYFRTNKDTEHAHVTW